MTTVNPEILVWARETAGYSLDDAAKAIGLGSSGGKSRRERLEALEHGYGDISRSQLIKMSKKYHRPLLIFYLEKPPPKGDRGLDFRTAQDSVQSKFGYLLDALIRDILARRNLVKSLLEDKDLRPHGYIGSESVNNGIEAVADSIVKTIGFQLDEFRKKSTIDEAFNYLRSKIEEAGVFVLLIGNLGSYHTNIPAEVFRGFAVADSLAPFVVINNQDARAAWSFTALHEVVHLFLGATGVSSVSLETELEPIERFCNEVASHILLPRSELQDLLDTQTCTIERMETRITEFARSRNISRAMVSYRFYQAELINYEHWQRIRNQFYDDWTTSKKRKKGPRAKGGPGYYQVKRHHLGRSLIELVRGSLSEGLITYTKASKVLGVKPRNVEPLFRT